MRAVYALRRAISTVMGSACSSRKITITWPARSTTATAVRKTFSLHAASAASAIVFAIGNERLRCVTNPWPFAVAASAMNPIVAIKRDM